MSLNFAPPPAIRYQLLHRTVSAIVEAKRLRTNKAAMVVHTFSQTGDWLEDYQRFLSLFGLETGINQSVSTNVNNSIDLTFAGKVSSNIALYTLAKEKRLPDLFLHFLI